MDTFVLQNMLTCIGNKRKLVKNIYEVFKELSIKLNKSKLNIVDGFSGSSVVTRQLSYIANNIYANDLELYAYLMSICYLNKPSNEQQNRIEKHINIMNNIAKKGPFVEGIISKLYAPQDTCNIKIGERCFYTRENALIIDTLRNYITEHVEEDIEVYCLVPLLNKASIHTNTSGVFKGFYKKDSIGHFGGKKEVALSRIMKPINLEVPIWNNESYTFQASNIDTNLFIKDLPNDIDVIYLDPPYNQHPYGSNYFMLNIIAKNEEPVNISKVSGIPTNWNKSSYNTYVNAKKAMKELIDFSLTKSKYVIVSYNNEGIIKSKDFDEMLANYKFEKREVIYDTFKGSRNLKQRSNKVIELMYIISHLSN